MDEGRKTREMTVEMNGEVRSKTQRRKQLGRETEKTQSTRRVQDGEINCINGEVRSAGKDGARGKVKLEKKHRVVKREERSVDVRERNVEVYQERCSRTERRGGNAEVERNLSICVARSSHRSVAVDILHRLQTITRTSQELREEAMPTAEKEATGA